MVTVELAHCTTERHELGRVAHLCRVEDEVVRGCVSHSFHETLRLLLLFAANLLDVHDCALAGCTVVLDIHRALNILSELSTYGLLSAFGS